MQTAFQSGLGGRPQALLPGAVYSGATSEVSALLPQQQLGESKGQQKSTSHCFSLVLL